MTRAPGTMTPVAEIELPGEAPAPRLARRALAGRLDRLRPVRRVDVLLLTSEIVTACVEAGRARGATDPIRLRIEQVANGVKIEARARVCGDFSDPLTRALLDRLADEWSSGKTRVAFLMRDGNLAPPASMSEDELFRLAAAGDHDARQALFDRYEAFARSLVRRFARDKAGRADLVQVASVGLIKAIDRYDPASGAKFTTFAARTIEGELKRFMRDTSWSVRLPRRLQELTLRVGHLERELEQRLGRPPRVDELAAALEVAPGSVAEALVARDAYTAMSIETEDATPDPYVEEFLAREDPRLVAGADRADLLKGLERLPGRERHILYLKYFEDKSQAEIADQLGLSQMHVSRLIRHSLAVLRDEAGRIG